MGIEHRLTEPYSPQTNNMVERMNSRIVENILDKIQFKSNEELENVLKKYLNNYNHFIKQKNHDYLSPIEYIKKNYPHLNLDSIDLHNQVKYNK